MRLLEFNLDASGANPHAQTPPQTAPKQAVRPVKLVKPPVSPAKSGKVLPLKTSAAPAKTRKPIDLERLQQRIDVLESRILARNGKSAEQPVNQDLELLKQRVTRLQQSVHAELWAARQREHTLLEILSKPSFKTVIIQRLKTFRQKQLPAAGHWLVSNAQQWWLDHKYPGKTS